MLNRMMLCALFALSCAAPVPPSQQQPAETARDADITGLVTSVQPDRIRVEATPNEMRGAKAVVRITVQTVIRDESGNTIASTAIREGQRVSVWFAGEVAQSYPLQADAAQIRVLSQR